jgi:hypothetical protein
MATSSNYQSSSKRSRYEGKEELKQSNTSSRKIWACSNPLIGQCQEHDYNDQSMLNEKKIKSYDEEKICRQKCGLPRDLLNLVLQSTGQKERSTLRESGKSIQSLFPRKESKKEEQDRLLYNELMKQCSMSEPRTRTVNTGSPTYSSTLIDPQSEKIRHLLNNHSIDNELLFLLFLAAIENNCSILFESLIESPQSINKLTSQDLVLIIKKILDTNFSDVSYYLDGLILYRIIPLKFMQDFLETDVNTFVKYLRSKNGNADRNTIQLLFSSPVLLKRLLLLTDKEIVRNLAKIVAKELKQKISYNNILLLTMTDQISRETNKDSEKAKNILLRLKRVVDEIEGLKNSYYLFLKIAPDLISEGNNNNWPSFPNYPSLDNPEDRKYFGRLANE